MYDCHAAYSDYVRFKALRSTQLFPALRGQGGEGTLQGGGAALQGRGDGAAGRPICRPRYSDLYAALGQGKERANTDSYEQLLHIHAHGRTDIQTDRDSIQTLHDTRMDSSERLVHMHAHRRTNIQTDGDPIHPHHNSHTITGTTHTQT